MCLLSITEYHQSKWTEQVAESSCCMIWSTHFTMSSGIWQHAVLAGKYQHFRGTCYSHLPEETLVCVYHWDGITLVCVSCCDGITLVCVCYRHSITLVCVFYWDGITMACVLLRWHHTGMCLLLTQHHTGVCLLLTQHHNSDDGTFWLQFCRYFKIFMLKNSIQYSLDIHN
jgi:hypothetical protein